MIIILCRYPQPPPFVRFNPEVIFHATTISDDYSVLRVDSLLFNSYDVNDLRRYAFFKNNSDNTYSFKGHYSGNSINPFAGIATDEVFLIRAECYARMGNKDSAVADLNNLLRSRWKKLNGITTYVDQTANDSNDALSKVLVERRKELVMRNGLRWTDLRRLNHGITLKRILNNQTYELPPNDLRYTFLIPQIVIDKSGVEQNPR